MKSGGVQVPDSIDGLVAPGEPFTSDRFLSEQPLGGRLAKAGLVGPDPDQGQGMRKRIIAVASQIARKAFLGDRERDRLDRGSLIRSSQSPGSQGGIPVAGAGRRFGFLDVKR